MDYLSFEYGIMPYYYGRTDILSSVNPSAILLVSASLTNKEPVIQLIVILAVIGIVLWMINTYLPIAQPLKTCINVVAGICVVLFLLSAFGVLHSMDAVGVPQLGGSHEYRR